MIQASARARCSGRRGATVVAAAGLTMCSVLLVPAARAHADGGVSADSTVLGEDCYTVYVAVEPYPCEFSSPDGTPATISVNVLAPDVPQSIVDEGQSTVTVVNDPNPYPGAAWTTDCAPVSLTFTPGTWTMPAQAGCPYLLEVHHVGTLGAALIPTAAGVSGPVGQASGQVVNVLNSYVAEWTPLATWAIDQITAELTSIASEPTGLATTLVAWEEKWSGVSN